MDKKRIIVWGLGNCGRHFIDSIRAYDDVQIVGVTDINLDKINNSDFSKAYHVMEPVKISDDSKFDFIVIAVYSEGAFLEIKTMAELVLNRKECCEIIKWDCFLEIQRKTALLRKYSKCDEFKTTLNYLRNNKLTVKNNYANPNKTQYPIKFDECVGLPYVIYYGKKMYYPLKYDRLSES